MSETKQYSKKEKKPSEVIHKPRREESNRKSGKQQHSRVEKTLAEVIHKPHKEESKRIIGMPHIFMVKNGEDDISDQTDPFPLKICDTWKSTMSTRSNNLSPKEREARLLSQATNQATNAAQSVLSAGGTESTAMKAAKATAASVLRAYYEKRNGELGYGLKDWFQKRRLKKRAEVVASMALLMALEAAATPMPQEEEDILISETDSGTARSISIISDGSSVQSDGCGHERVYMCCHELVVSSFVSDR
mmetsp:Transcript_18365/g.20445  ORF Transcript_18365/g.20445 Transcript_18365/m.20445 type:complete len:248 (+) Transcript_18365:29-772(+)